MATTQQGFDDLINDNDSPKQNIDTNHDVADNYIPGLNEEEIQDPNKIHVTIPDTSTPIVVLFGSPSCGKTLALFRLVRFLEKNGYTAAPERVFRPTHDKHYQKMCDEFQKNVYSAKAPEGNDSISFMLVKILDNHGHPICQILEAPGEHYFLTKNPTREFPLYIKEIISTPNRKTWVFFCEQDWGDDQDQRTAYALKIQSMQFQINQIGKPGKIVFLFNKADKFPHQYNNAGFPNADVFFRNISNQYPGIFDRYRNSGFSSFLFGQNKFKAIPYSVGSFTKADDGTKTWTLGNDWYCEQFWKAIR